MMGHSVRFSSSIERTYSQFVQSTRTIVMIKAILASLMKLKIFENFRKVRPKKQPLGVFSILRVNIESWKDETNIGWKSTKFSTRIILDLSTSCHIWLGNQSDSQVLSKKGGRRTFWIESELTKSGKMWVCHLIELEVCYRLIPWSSIQLLMPSRNSSFPKKERFCHFWNFSLSIITGYARHIYSCRGQPDLQPYIITIFPL